MPMRRPARTSNAATPGVTTAAAVEPTASQIEMGAVPVVSSEPPPSTATTTTMNTTIVTAATTNTIPIPSNATEPTMTGATLGRTTPPRPPAEDMEGRHEWARRRANALLHRQSVVHPAGNVDIEEEERQRIAGLPRWRKMLGGVFPGLRN